MGDLERVVWALLVVLLVGLAAPRCDYDVATSAPCYAGMLTERPDGRWDVRMKAATCR